MNYDTWKSTEPEFLDPGRRREEDDDAHMAPTCDRCGVPLLGGAKSLAGVGIACSDRCLNALCLRHEQAMAR